MTDRIEALRKRLEDIRDERHFPSHMLDTYDEMVAVLDEMATPPASDAAVPAGEAHEHLRTIEPVRFIDDHGDPGLLYTPQQMVDAFKAGAAEGMKAGDAAYACASDASCICYPGINQAAERAAFCAGAAYNADGSLPAADRLTDTGERFAQMIADLRYLTSEDFDARYSDFAKDINARGPAWGKPTAQDYLAVLIDYAIAALATPKPPVDAGAMRERCAIAAEDYADHYLGGSEGIAAAIRNLSDDGETM